MSKKYKKLGLITESAAQYCEDLATEIEKQAGPKQLELVHEHFLPSTQDYRTLLLRLK